MLNTWDDDLLHEPGVRRCRALFISDLHLGTKACQAEAFIDFLMRPDVAGEIVTVVRTSSPNSKAAENVSPELQADSTIFPPHGWLQTQIDLDTFDLKVQRDINRYYTLVKANETFE